MPLPAMKGRTTMAAGQALHAPLIGGRHAAARATGHPAGWPRGGPARQGVPVAHGHFKVGLGRIDRSHPGPKQRPMGLPHLEHPIHPGVDHFVGEGPQQGPMGQRLEQGPRQHDLAELPAIAKAAPAVEPGRTGHAGIAPAQRHQGLPTSYQAAVEMLTVEPVEQRQQGLDRHGGHFGGAVGQTLGHFLLKRRDGLGSDP